MPINKLPEFAQTGEKNTQGLTETAGFPSLVKPARQWFNYLFNALSVKTNEVIDRVDEVDNRVTALIGGTAPTNMNTITEIANEINEVIDRVDEVDNRVTALIGGTAPTNMNTITEIANEINEVIDRVDEVDNRVTALIGGTAPTNMNTITEIANELIANASTDAKQVSVAATQAFTPAEKEQARENIEAVGMQAITDGLAAMAAGVSGYPRITGLAVARALPVTATGASNGLQYASPSLVRAANTFSYTCRQIFGTVRMVGHTYGGYVNIYVNGTVVYGGYGAGGWVDTVITVTEGDLIQATCGGSGYYNFSIYVNDPIVELSPIVYASQLNISGNTSLIAGLITASTSVALNDQWLRVLSGNQVGYLATDGSVPANQYALANAFNLTGQFDSNNFYGFIVDVEWLVLSGTVMIEPNTTDVQDRSTQIIQTRAGATIFTETYASAALARPVLSVEVGDSVKVSIEQNSTGVSVALRWIPTFS